MTNEWIREKTEHGTYIWLNDRPLPHSTLIAYLPKEQSDKAELICTAINACKFLNPENPMAVASSIEIMYKHLEVAGEQFDNIKKFHDLDYTIRAAITRLLPIIKAKLESEPSA